MSHYIPPDIFELQHDLHFESLFAQNQRMELFAIKPRIVTNAEAKKINKEMSLVISGKRQDTKAGLAKNAKQTVKKIEKKSWSHI